MALPMKEKLSLALWWGVALSITGFLAIGVVNTATVILQ